MTSGNKSVIGYKKRLLCAKFLLCSATYKHSSLM